MKRGLTYYKILGRMHSLENSTYLRVEGELASAEADGLNRERISHQEIKFLRGKDPSYKIQGEEYLEIGNSRYIVRFEENCRDDDFVPVKIPMKVVDTFMTNLENRLGMPLEWSSSMKWRGDDLDGLETIWVYRPRPTVWGWDYNYEGDLVRVPYYKEGAHYGAPRVHLGDDKIVVPLVVDGEEYIFYLYEEVEDWERGAPPLSVKFGGDAENYYRKSKPLSLDEDEEEEAE